MALTVLQWNCRGFQPRKHELERYLRETPAPPDVVCVEETFLKANKNPKVDGYSVYRQDSARGCGGGLAILLKTGINHTLLRLEEVEGVERQGIELCTAAGKLTIINVYISPTNIVSKAQVDCLFPTRHSLIVGDFNAHSKSWKDGRTDPGGRLLEEVVQERDLVVLNTGQATLCPRPTCKNNSVIDLALTTRDMALRCSHRVLNSNLGSDHMLTMTTIDEVADHEPDAGLHHWSLRKADWKLFKENSRLKIHEGLITDHAETTFQNFMEELRQTTSSAMPERKASGR